jgi:hypothetical protein
MLPSIIFAIHFLLSQSEAMKLSSQPTRSLADFLDIRNISVSLPFVPVTPRKKMHLYSIDIVTKKFIPKIIETLNMLKPLNLIFPPSTTLPLYIYQVCIPPSPSLLNHPYY